ncbi:protein phosphatase 2C domain-containing protein [Streptomyces sp. NPDC046197]|uniref:protein phosphatase 2C domain-containing protein n=1 Tax=Streptomyces sp. NPDC046197 TaxID=3154337 RepID=UPI0033E222F0
MSQQGGRPTGNEDDWWKQLYDDSTEDTGPTTAADSLDDRFASAAGTLGRTPGAPGAWETQGTAETLRTPGTPGTARRSRAEDAAGEPPVRIPPEDRPAPDAPAVNVPSPRSSRPADETGPPPGPGPDWWRRAPWEAPPDATAGPVNLPPAPRPPESADRARRGGTPSPSGEGTPMDAPVPTIPSAPSSGRPPATPRPPSAPPAPPAPPPPSAPPAVPASTPPSAPTPPSEPPSPPGPPADRISAGPAPVPQERIHAQAGFPQPLAHGRSATPDVRSDPPESPPVDPPAPVGHVGSRPPTYDAEPTVLPLADPDELDDLVPDTVLDGARYGSRTLRAVSIRGDSARYRGEPRRDALLTARFGGGEQALLLVAMATGARATPGAHRAAAEACQWIARSVGRSQARLVDDIRAARRGDLKSGLHRLTDRSLGRLRASAAEQGIAPEEYAAGLRCLLVPADPDCRTRVFFGVGEGGLFRLRDGEWQDIEPRVSETTGDPVVGFGSVPEETPEGDRLTMDLGVTRPPNPYDPFPQRSEPSGTAAEPPREPFRFRASVAQPGDTLLLCTAGLADPLRGEPELCAYLGRRWSGPTPPGLAAFLADTQVRVKGYADDRTAVAVWEA